MAAVHLLLGEVVEVIVVVWNVVLACVVPVEVMVVLEGAVQELTVRVSRCSQLPEDGVKLEGISRLHTHTET